MGAYSHVETDLKRELPMSAHHAHHLPRNLNKKRLLLALLVVGSWMCVELRDCFTDRYSRLEYSAAEYSYSFGGHTGTY